MQAQTTILPQTSATKYEVREFRDVSYRTYRAELRILRLQLLLLQEWVVEQGKRVAIVLEGRDAAGKGSTASGITHYLNPKFANIVEQGIPTAKQMRNWLGTHYNQLPVGGNITVFDRSWYSRALIQHDYAPWIVIESDNKHQARLNVFHYILNHFEYDGKNLSLESIEPHTNGRYLTDMIVDGVLFKDMDPDQVEVLERILMHE
ncbi:Probable polyphosphate kinase PKK2A [Geodia barretti]|uniref:Probable polyphosphate kinase PKK2A n=1 Tax=Geodia barretti TaxID=519541 RepID=A0AA35SI43_GEOBA|nr:Probable polyphosphate kinase PKK2A [Geodia barretti]